MVTTCKATSRYTRRPDPTPEEIEQRAVIERAAWTPHDFWNRSGGKDGTPSPGHRMEWPSVLPLIHVSDILQADEI